MPVSINSNWSGDQIESVSRTLKAIAHPVRLSIIDMLEHQKQMTVTEIYTRLDIDQSAVSHHLSIMKDRGVLGANRMGKHIYYFLKEPGFLTLINSVSELNHKFESEEILEH